MKIDLRVRLKRFKVNSKIVKFTKKKYEYMKVKNINNTRYVSMKKDENY